jgi:DNA-binding SARP family transcriptional activator
MSAGCEGYLLPIAPLLPTLLDQWRGLRQLTRAGRQVLQRLAATLTPERVAISSDPAVLTLSPFGQGAAYLGSQPIDLFALRAKARELLFFTAQADDDLPRDVFLEALWPHDDAPLPSFWNAGRDLRRVFGDDCWFPQAGLYRLRIPVVDLSRRAEALLRVALGTTQKRELIAAAEEALALIRDGPYLVWCESMWALATRTRLTEAASAAAQAASRAHFSLGNRDAALHLAREAIRLDPLAEGPRRLLLQQLMALGLGREAHGAYDEYRAVLYDELGAMPPKDLRVLVSG